MEKCFLGNISTKYIILKICSYIKDKNFIYHLMLHSKSIQKKMNFEIPNYKEYYFDKKIYKKIYSNDNIIYYLSNYLSDESENNKKVYLENYFKNYQKNLIKLNYNKESILYEYFQNITFNYYEHIF